VGWYKPNFILRLNAFGRSLPVASSADIGQFLMQTVVRTNATGWSMETNTEGHAGAISQTGF